MDRGILSTSYAIPTGDTSTDDLLSLYREFYADEPFVRVLAGLPATKHVSGTNFCDITARVVRGRVVVLSARSTTSSRGPPARRCKTSI